MKLTSDVVKKISSIKGEPKWMLDFRLTSLDAFNKSSNPDFGPKLDIDYDSINYYKEREEKLEKARANAKPGSLASKANMVKNFNENK